MDTKIKVMISLGSSYAAGCIPCFDHYYMLAKEEKIAGDDIKEIIAIAKKVRNGSDIALEKAISDVIDGKEDCVKIDDESHPCKCC
jgi:alkylhydroperoxidase/carboxymuconolactone decarboxylase family protein YurZ